MHLCQSLYLIKDEQKKDKYSAAAVSVTISNIIIMCTRNFQNPCRISNMFCDVTPGCTFTQNNLLCTFRQNTLKCTVPLVETGASPACIPPPFCFHLRFRRKVPLHRTPTPHHRTLVCSQKLFNVLSGKISLEQHSRILEINFLSRINTNAS